MQKPYFVKLPGRAILHLEGDDRHTFLQNLISNDIRELKQGALLYTCVLTAQGKFMFDGFLSEGNGFTLFEVEGGERAQKLAKHLNMYRLRSKVKISVEDNAAVYAGTGITAGLPDPRHLELGFRSFEKPAGDESAFDTRDIHRISLGVPDGSRDIAVDKDTLLECNIDKFNGLSHTKGCYLGQEITARMHLRGLVKKHLRVVEWKDTPPAPFTDIYVEEKLIGQARSSCDKLGLALIKDDVLPLAESAPFVVKD